MESVEMFPNGIDPTQTDVPPQAEAEMPNELTAFGTTLQNWITSLIPNIDPAVVEAIVQSTQDMFVENLIDQDPNVLEKHLESFLITFDTQVAEVGDNFSVTDLEKFIKSCAHNVIENAINPNVPRTEDMNQMDPITAFGIDLQNRIAHLFPGIQPEEIAPFIRSTQDMLAENAMGMTQDPESAETLVIQAIDLFMDEFNQETSGFINNEANLSHIVQLIHSCTDSVMENLMDPQAPPAEEMNHMDPLTAFGTTLQNRIAQLAPGIHPEEIAPFILSAKEMLVENATVMAQDPEMVETLVIQAIDIFMDEFNREVSGSMGGEANFTNLIQLIHACTDSAMALINEPPAEEMSQMDSITAFGANFQDRITQLVPDIHPAEMAPFIRSTQDMLVENAMGMTQDPESAETVLDQVIDAFMVEFNQETSGFLEGEATIADIAQIITSCADSVMENLNGTFDDAPGAPENDIPPTPTDFLQANLPPHADVHGRPEYSIAPLINALAHGFEFDEAMVSDTMMSSVDQQIPMGILSQGIVHGS